MCIQEKALTDNEVEQIITNVIGTLSYEGMNLPSSTINLYKKYLTGENSSDEVRTILLEKYYKTIKGDLYEKK